MSVATGDPVSLAAVVGRPIDHSLSPLIHAAWIEAAGLSAAYFAFSTTESAFEPTLRRLGGVLSGVNVTAPFKEMALKLSDRALPGARRAAAANLLLFEPGGAVVADNTDGVGLLAAFADQAPGFDPAAAPMVILGAGGAARGAISAFIDAGAPEVRVINRTPERAEALVAAFGDRVKVVMPERSEEAIAGAGAIINAISGGPAAPLSGACAEAVVMDMTYRPLVTPLLRAAQARGLRTVDGLAMLIGQARPSFEALFGRSPPADVDVRALALAAMEARS